MTFAEYIQPNIGAIVEIIRQNDSQHVDIVVGDVLDTIESFCPSTEGYWDFTEEERLGVIRQIVCRTLGKTLSFLGGNRVRW